VPMSNPPARQSYRPPDRLPTYLSIEAAAFECSVHPNTIRRWIKESRECERRGLRPLFGISDKHGRAGRTLIHTASFLAWHAARQDSGRRLVYVNCDTGERIVCGYSDGWSGPPVA
jgi:hypothetical protein